MGLAGHRQYLRAAAITSRPRDATASLATLKAMVLVDMIGDRDLVVRRDANSTPWLTDLVWGAAERLELDNYFVPESTRVERRSPAVPGRRRAIRSTSSTSTTSRGTPREGHLGCGERPQPPGGR